MSVARYDLAHLAPCWLSYRGTIELRLSISNARPSKHFLQAGVQRLGLLRVHNPVGPLTFCRHASTYTIGHSMLLSVSASSNYSVTCMSTKRWRHRRHELVVPIFDGLFLPLACGICRQRYYYQLCLTNTDLMVFVIP